jgi:hypothetical protein
LITNSVSEEGKKRKNLVIKGKKIIYLPCHYYETYIWVTKQKRRVSFSLEMYSNGYYHHKKKAISKIVP